MTSCRPSVLMASNRFAPSQGGVQTYVGRLADALANAGTRVHVVTHRLDDDTAPREELTSGVTVTRIRPVVTLRHALIAPAVAAHVRRLSREFDVIHAHSLHDPITAIALAVWPGPSVLHTHYHGGSDDPRRDLAHRVVRPVHRRMVRQADHVVAVTSAEAGIVAPLADSEDSLRDKMSVIGSGIDVSDIATAAPIRTAQHRTQIVAPGRLVSYKRTDRMIRAMQCLRESHHLTVLGVGPDLPRLRGLVDSLGLAEVVDFVVAPDDQEMRGRLCGADVVVSASELEAQGIIPLEGIAAGAAVVMSDIEAHRETHRRFPDQTFLLGAERHDDDARIVRNATEATFDADTNARRLTTWSETAELIAETHRRAIARHGSVRVRSPRSASSTACRSV